MYEKKKALLIGVNEYDYYNRLKGCENDVSMMEEVLQCHEKGDPNFSISKSLNNTNETIKAEISSLLERDATMALLYFSGHGNVTDDGGFICGSNTSKDNSGVSMDWIIEQINKSIIPEVTVILDCCFAGGIANEESDGTLFTRLRKGVTILAATTENDTATEFLRKGVFTSILYNGLKGAAKDILGHVTAVSLYSNAESILSPWEQRPVFKSFVKQLTPLRFCLPTVRKRILRQMFNEPYFSLKEKSISLDFKSLQDESGKIGKNELFVLASFEKARLLECPDRIPLLQAIVEGKTCFLSPYGKHVWELFKNNQA
ncbi:caspase family protein [Fluviicola taffensis]|nr:caspase family protein [Fluviicola taffensis]